MQPLRILITNLTLATRTGTETYVRDLALRLLRRGHQPIVYSPDLGEIAQEIRHATVPVIEDLNALAIAPDVIHGHHHLELMTALLHFPNVPAVFICHDRLAWHDTPPLFPRIHRYVAVDDNCRDRLVCESSIPPDQVCVLLNAVDLERFHPRGPLPARPQRALVFSNTATEHSHLQAIRQVCTRLGIALDVIGAGVGKSSARPEEILGQYDLVFAKARCALEALAVGAAVVLCDSDGAGPMVRAVDLERLRRLNLGRRTLTEPVHPEILCREIMRYDAQDASIVSSRIRRSAGLDSAVDDLLNLYQEVLAHGQTQQACDPQRELQAVAHYFRRMLSTKLVRDLHLKTIQLGEESAYWQAELRRVHSEREHWQSEARQAQQQCENWQREWEGMRREREQVGSRCTNLESRLSAVHASLTVRLRNRIVKLPILGILLRLLHPKLNQQ